MLCFYCGGFDCTKKEGNKEGEMETRTKEDAEQIKRC